MPQAARQSRSTSASRRKSTGANGTDAIALLKADHRQVEEWFQQFLKGRSGEKKGVLARRICQALRVHAQIEEEIFYPAFLEATGDEDIHHEAEVEHAGAKVLIGKIEKSGPSNEYFDAQVKVLSEMIKHHVKEEEKRDGMFAKARKSGMDLKTLGARLSERKEALEASNGSMH